jgi:hypothetical protein
LEDGVEVLGAVGPFHRQDNVLVIDYCHCHSTELEVAVEAAEAVVEPLKLKM